VPLYREHHPALPVGLHTGVTVLRTKLADAGTASELEDSEHTGVVGAEVGKHGGAGRQDVFHAQNAQALREDQVDAVEGEERREEGRRKLVFQV
jgi:hypothetical protein